MCFFSISKPSVASFLIEELFVLFFDALFSLIKEDDDEPDEEIDDEDEEFEE